MLNKVIKGGLLFALIFFAWINPKVHKNMSRPSWVMDMVIILWLIISKFDGWVRLEAWAAIGRNTVHIPIIVSLVMR